ncbi:MAG: heme exporter protein D [Bacteroidia bacterium]|jgi:heme exporter protein D
MYFETIDALLHMDGHGVYVWPAYIVTVVVLTCLLVLPMRRQRRLLNEIAGVLKRAKGQSATTEESN